MAHDAVAVEVLRESALAPADTRVSSLLRFVRRRPLGAAGFFLLLIMASGAILAPAIAPYDYDLPDFTARLQSPSWTHLLGTDQLGRDILSRVIWGTRVSLGVSLAAVTLAQGTAAALAIFSGYYGGWTDTIIQRFVDVWQALPTLIIVITLIGIVGPSIGVLIAIVGLATAPRATRLIRSVVVQVREEPYIEAAQAIGVPNRQIMTRYILPNVAHVMMYSATVALGSVILIVTSLGFLGYGVPPPHPDLGAMLSGDGLTFMRRQPMIAVAPGVAIAIAVFSFNVFGDALRDALDPRLRGR